MDILKQNPATIADSALHLNKYDINFLSIHLFQPLKDNLSILIKLHQFPR